MRTMNRFVSLSLCLLMLLASIPLSAAAAGPLTIGTADEFRAFVNGDAAADAVLTADIDLGEWTTAFTDGYSGTLDGAGHSVTYTKTNPAGNFHSLIKILNADGAIKNLTVKGSMTFTAARTYNAPFVYENHGLIENCVNEMTVSHSGTKNCQYCAGFAAKNYGTVSGCVNNADITVRNYAGGVVAQNLGGTVTGCRNNGKITATNAAGYAGGVVAAVGAATSADRNLIEACVNAGDVTGGSGDYGFAGGIVGQVNVASSYNTYDGHPTLTVKGCASSGALSAGGGTDEFVAKNNNPDNCPVTIEAGAPAHTHTYDAGEVTKDPTCVEAGIKTFTCTSCDETAEGHTYTEPIAPTGIHTPGEWTEETIDGEALLVKRCAVCGNITAKKSAAAAATLQNALAALNESWFKPDPVFGRDTNVARMVENKLNELGYEGIAVSVQSAENPADGAAAIAQDGTVTFFYADPAVWRAMYFSSIPVVFSLKLEDAEETWEKNAVVRWDAEKAKAAIEAQVVSRVTEDLLRGDNSSLSEVTGDLTLPRAVTDDEGEAVLWSLITWESGDEAVIAVDDSAQGSADTLFAPYIGKVKRSMEDKTVTLTARYSFQKTAYDEAPITLEKTYTVTVKGMGDELLDKMQRELDENYLAEKLTYIGSKAPVDPAAVTDDIQLLLPRTSGIEDPNDYTFTVETDSPYAAVNTARLNILRPLPGEAPAEVTLTVTMAHRQYDYRVQKTVTLTVKPLEEAEIAARNDLMARVKAALFEGLNNGANESADAVTESLSPFIEARTDEDGGLIWIRNVRETNGDGIVTVSVDPARPSEQWDRFRSSAPAVLSHETLLLTRPEADTPVDLTLCLSDARFARYAEAYPDDPRFAELNRQTVTLSLTVKGTKPAETPEEPGEEEPAGTELCPFCGNAHGGFFGRLIAFFHRALLFFRNLKDKIC